jgi:hypothetical protein
MGNGIEDRPEDFVAVAETWSPPDAFDGITSKGLLRVQHAVHDRCLRENAQANEWVGQAIGPLLGLNSHDKAAVARLKKMIKVWIA